MDNILAPFVQTQSDDLKSLCMICLIKLNKMGDGFPAGAAPRCPEVQENHLPSCFGKDDLPVIERLDRKVRGRG